MAAQKARGACRPGRDELSEGKFIKAFLSYFLCLTKSMEKFPAGNNRNATKGGEKAAERQRI